MAQTNNTLINDKTSRIIASVKSSSLLLSVYVRVIDVGNVIGELHNINHLLGQFISARIERVYLLYCMSIKISTIA